MTSEIATPNRSEGDIGRAGGCCGAAHLQLSADDAHELAGQLGAVADPVRLQMLSIIAGASGGEVCACDFVGPIGKSQPTVSHHLKVLSEAGLIDGERRGRWIWYRLAPSAVGEIATALTAVTACTATTGSLDASDASGA